MLISGPAYICLTSKYSTGYPMSFLHFLIRSVEGTCEAMNYEMQMEQGDLSLDFQWLSNAANILTSESVIACLFFFFVSNIGWALRNIS